MPRRDDTALRKKRLKYARNGHALIRTILMESWDPIGVADIPEAADEYDSYIGQIFGLLIRREPTWKLVEFLWWAETENMGLAGSRHHTERVAEQLVSVWNMRMNNDNETK